MSALNNKDFDKDLEFVYDDCDDYANEISELYTYTEEPEFEINLENFEILLKSKDFKTWTDLDYDARKSLIMHIIQAIELADKTERLKALTWLLYLVQGVYGECTDKEEQTRYCRENCVLLYKMGVFAIVKDLLMMEISMTENDNDSESKKSNLFSIADCTQLRNILIILYTMVETLRRDDENDTEEMTQARKEFLHDLGHNLNDSESLVIILFNMVLNSTSCFPMKKVLLLIWKLLLAILGGFESIYKAKEEKRKKAGLQVLDENPLEIVQNMKASAPPTSASDILEIAQGPRRRPRRDEIERNGLDSDFDGNRDDKTDSVPFEEEKVTSIDDDLIETSDPVRKIILDSDSDPLLDQSNDVLVISEEKLDKDEDPVLTPAPGAMTPMPFGKGPSTSGNTESIAAKLINLKKQQQEEEDMLSFPVVKAVSGLPWIPKAREKDVETFLNLVREKFIGFSLPGDLTTEAGLPNPTKDSVSVLRKHLYTPLADIEVAKEAETTKFPLTIGKNEVVVDTLTERLYQALLPNLPQYVIALLKILLAAAPTSKAKNDSINVLCDVLPEVMPSGNVDSLKVGIDVNRHREIIVKAISGILLLLLKHFKLSHVYQFEYASQHLVFANCIPLVLKFFNHNIVAYVTTKNSIPCLEFPDCVIGEKIELTAESLEGLDTSTAPCWRNLFSCINLLRILNKLVKLKHSRTIMLVVFKSAPILRRALKVRQAMFQLYVLKLLKIQTKYLGRQWRKSNMKIMSAIYQKVRHRLNDDWAFGNDVDARPWDFQQEECALRSHVERFNLRRYHMSGSRTGGTANISPCIEEDYEPVDNNIQNLLREEIELPSDFRKSYDVWLEREVFSSKTDWDQLLAIPCVQ